MKKLLALVLALMMVVALVACGSSDSSASTGSDDAAASTPAETEEEEEPAEVEAEEPVAEEPEAEVEAEEEAVPEDTSFSITPYSSGEDYTVYHVFMTMQAGYQEYNPHDSGMMTIHAGIGYIDPLGEGYYYAGIGFDEMAGNEEAIYVSDWMDGNYGCSLFCVYSLPDGDIYAWDGIYGANAKDMANYMSGDDAYTEDEVNGSTPTRSDVLINIVVGGTGAYEGASGIMIGSTSGGGRYDTTLGMTLPQTLFKLMEGYVKVPNDATSTSTHSVTQELSEDTSVYNVLPNEYAMVDVTLRLQSGTLENDATAEGGGGTGAGIGTMLPFNADALTTNMGNDIAEAANYPIENYVNDNWLDEYGDPTFIVFHIDDGTVAGDMYGWEFDYATILDTSNDLATTGTQKAAFTMIVDGTGDFAGVTGILGGHTATSNQAGWGLEGVTYDNDMPLANLTLMTGSLKVPASSKIVSAGVYANDTIMDD